MPTQPYESPSTQSLSLPMGDVSFRLPARTFGLSGNPIFSRGGISSKITEPTAIAASAVVDEILGGDPLGRDLDPRGALTRAQRAFEQRGNFDAARLVGVMLSDLTAVEQDLCDLSQLERVGTAQKELCIRHGVFVGLPPKDYSVAAVAPVSETISMVASDGKPHTIIILDTAQRGNLIGQFRPPQCIVVNKNFAKEQYGADPLSAIVANELAHSYLTSHGFYAWRNHMVDFSRLDSQHMLIDPTATALCDALKERGSATQRELHELFSDCWSTTQSPSFDRSRILRDAISHVAHRQACDALGRPVSGGKYDLPHELFCRYVYLELAPQGKAELLLNSISAMQDLETRSLLLSDALTQETEPTRNLDLQVELSILNQEKDAVREQGAMQICAALGSSALERQRRTYSDLGQALLDFIRLQPGWRE